MDFATYKPLLGFDFGKPFRSISLEIIRSAIGEWERDGWICMHNSFLNIMYRAGLVGLAFLVVLCWAFCYMTKIFIDTRSLEGIALCTIILNWFVAANFTIILELPYTAIPVWTIFGLTLAYAHDHVRKISARAQVRK